MPAVVALGVVIVVDDGSALDCDADVGLSLRRSSWSRCPMVGNYFLWFTVKNISV